MRFSSLRPVCLSLVIGLSLLSGCSTGTGNRSQANPSPAIAPPDPVAMTPPSPQPPLPKGYFQSSYHIGNSLTDMVEGWLKQIAGSAGYKLHFLRSTIPGAPTDWNWDHPGESMGEADYRTVFNTKAPINHLFIQPYAGHDRSIDNEVDYAGRFYELARRKSPNVQLWIYAQWPDKKMDDPWSQAAGSAASLNLSPAKTWEAAAENQLKYHEAVRQKLDEKFKDQRVLIVPAGLALARLKQAIAAGQVPGMTDFFSTQFLDEIHLNARGSYLVSLAHYICIFRKNPQGVTFENTGLTQEQAAVYQKIAWETVSRYPWSAVQP